MTIHEEITKERYLDLRAQGAAKQEAFDTALNDADFFTVTYAAWRSAEQKAAKAHISQSKGCPDCFGSGGKKADPCKTCGGSGRIYSQFDTRR